MATRLPTNLHSRPISGEEVRKIVNAKNYSEVASNWGKVADWFCESKKEAAKSAFDTFNHHKDDAEIGKAFFELMSLSGEEYKTNFTYHANYNPRKGPRGLTLSIQIDTNDLVAITIDTINKQFDNAQWAGLDLQKLNFHGATLNWAELTGTKFDLTNCLGVRFYFANLTQAQLKNMDARTLSGLETANLTDTQINLTFGQDPNVCREQIEACVKFIRDLGHNYPALQEDLLIQTIHGLSHTSDTKQLDQSILKLISERPFLKENPELKKFLFEKSVSECKPEWIHEKINHLFPIGGNYEERTFTDNGNTITLHMPNQQDIITFEQCTNPKKYWVAIPRSVGHYTLIEQESLEKLVDKNGNIFTHPETREIINRNQVIEGKEFDALLQAAIAQLL